MKLKELLIAKFKNHTLCWYPSAGVDFNAINLWSTGHGNELNPTVFIYTDIDYKDFSGSSICLADETYFPEKATFEHLLDKIEDLPIYCSIYEYLSTGDISEKEHEEIVKKHVPVDNDRDYFESNVNLMKIGLLDAHNLIDQHNIDVPIPEAKGVLLKGIINNTYLIILKTCNRAFYDFCVSHLFPIPCLMVKRPDDDFIINKELNVNILNTSETCLCEHDAGLIDFPAESVHCEPFIWSSNYYDEPSHFVKMP